MGKQFAQAQKECVWSRSFYPAQQTCSDRGKTTHNWEILLDGSIPITFQDWAPFRICRFWFRFEAPQVACGIAGACARWLWEFGVDCSLPWIVSNILCAHTVKFYSHIWNSTTCFWKEYGLLASCLLSFSSGGLCSTAGAQLQHVSACLGFRTKSANLAEISNKSILSQAGWLHIRVYPVLPVDLQRRYVQPRKVVYCWRDNLFPAPEEPERGFLASAQIATLPPKAPQNWIPAASTPGWTLAVQRTWNTASLCLATAQVMLTVGSVHLSVELHKQLLFAGVSQQNAAVGWTSQSI